jgi:hypothetical protein
VLFSYLVAVLAEGWLLDGWLPRFGWTDHQGLAIYVAMQTAVVFGVIWLTSRPRTARQFARLAAWATPLFALPAYC